MIRKLKQLEKEKRELRKKELFGTIEINKYIETLNYLRATEQIKPKDKVETTQLELLIDNPKS